MRALTCKQTVRGSACGRLLAVGLLLVVAGCGGGSESPAPAGEEPDPPVSQPPAPTPVIPTLSVSDATVNEGDSSASDLVFVLTLSTATTVDVSVDYLAINGSAAAGEDFVPASGRLTIPAGDLAASVTVAVMGDTRVEANETLLFELSNPTNATLARASAGGIIVNDDAVVPVLSIADTETVEGDGTGNVLSFALTLSAATTVDVSVNYQTQDISAIAGIDYEAAFGRVTIAAGELAANIAVTVLGDAINEPDEALRLQIVNVVNAMAARDSATGSIVNDDVSVVVPSLSIADAVLQEGDDADSVLTFPVSLSQPTSVAIFVDYETVSLSAAAGSDFVEARGQLMISAGQRSAGIAVTVRGDTDVESDEVFELRLSNPVNVELGSSTATGTIVDDDVVVPVLSVADSEVSEGDDSDTTLTFFLSLTEVTTVDVSVEFATEDASASGADYVAAAGQVTVPAGNLSATIDILVRGDTEVESNEVFELRLSNIQNATLANDVALGTIVENDVAVPTLSVGDAETIEGDDANTLIVFTLTLSEVSASAVNVDYQTASVTAESDSDYMADSGQVSIPAGNLSETIEIVVRGDTEVESNEAFELRLSNIQNAALANDVAVGTILDNDVEQPTLSVADVEVTEGDDSNTLIVFTLSLSDISTLDVNVDYETASGSAVSGQDFLAVSDRAEIPAGERIAEVAVTVLGDVESESDETFELRLSNVSNATLANSVATATVIDNDGAIDEYGLDARPGNASCVAPDRPLINTQIALIDAYPGLPNISQPVKILLEPVPNPRFFVLRKSGQIVTFDPENATSTSVFMDLNTGRNLRTSSEGGLLGMAFHPDYPATPQVFLYYTIQHTSPAMRTVVSRFILDDTTTPGAATDEEVVLLVDQDQDNHNGGDIAFGPDGYLYIGLGDGGGGGDPRDRAQDTSRLLGSMLRIDVNGPAVPYGIPSDNPFAANEVCGPGANSNACPEIYAWGLRNPWRWSFDDATGELWLADVGQSGYEEVNVIERGGNYGWRCREGIQNYDLSNCDADATFVEPVTVYGRSDGVSIIGGQVYRGAAIPDLNGRYIFADYRSGRFWALEPDGQGGYSNHEILMTNVGITSFGIGADGELYTTDIDSSRIRKLVPSGPAQGGTIPDLLSNTGCAAALDTTQPASGLLPYDLNATFWSDGAIKDRYIALPDGEQIVRNTDGDWQFPNGTIIVKNFRLNGRLIETRHLMRHPDGIWAGYTYEWNAEQTDATRVVGGKTVEIAGRDWIYPSGAQCMQCHTSAAGFALGPEDAQLNKDFTYPSTGRTANQMETLDHIQVFTLPLEGGAEALPSMPDPTDNGAAIDDRARAYLHTNCAQCHRPGGSTPSTMDLRYDTPLTESNACAVAPLLGDLGVPDAQLIAPGNSSSSLLINRANRRDVHGMPPVGSSLVDAEGVELLRTWINQLASCD